MERIHEVEIPTGLPLVFNVRKKCIQVLEGEDWDDSSLESLDPLSRYPIPSHPILPILLHCIALSFSLAYPLHYYTILYSVLLSSSLFCLILLLNVFVECNHSSRYNFGTSPELLFKPCKVSDSEDEGGAGDGDAGADGEDQCYLGAEGRFYAYDPVIRLIPVQGVMSRSTSPDPSQPNAPGVVEKEGTGVLQEKRVDLVEQPEAPLVA